MPRALPVPLPRLLALLPRNGLGATVYESRWAGKGLPVPSAAPAPSEPEANAEACYWQIKKVKVSPTADGPARTRAYGVLHWKGKRVTPAHKEYEPIRGATKYLWQSAVPPTALVLARQALDAPANSSSSS